MRYEVLSKKITRRISKKQSAKQEMLDTIWSKFCLHEIDTKEVLDHIWEWAEPNKAKELSRLELVVAAEDDTN